jgi:tetratricopeptide (TPR) repeat protein
MTLEQNNGTTPVRSDELFAAVRELRLAGRWERALGLLEAAIPDGPAAHARIARAAAEVALERDWFAGTDTAAERITDAEKAFPGGDWDVAFLRLRHTYGRLLFVDGSLRHGPDGKDPEALDALLRRARELHDDAPDTVRRGWAAHYVGLITDNHFADGASAAAHYAAALRAGESGPDDLLAREALRHLGGQDHAAGAHDRALDRWRRATALGAGQGTVPGTLSQHLVLAVLARDTGDGAGARALAAEIVRWAEAIGATRLAAQATGFLAEAAPTTPPAEDGN